MDFDKRTEETVNKILKSYEDTKEINEIDIDNQPDKKAIIEIIHKLLKILYPGYYSDRIYRQYSCQTAHCGRGKPHFIFGGLASPIVPYRNLPQTLRGLTADCRSFV